MELGKTGEGQMELKELEKAMHIAKPTAFGIVKRLEKKSLVESSQSKEDKQIHIIQITPLGKECCYKARERMKQTEAMLISSMTETEQSILITLLQKVRNSF